MGSIQLACPLGMTCGTRVEKLCCGSLGVLSPLYSFVFQFAIQKVKDQDIWNYNIARCSVWV